MASSATALLPGYVRSVSHNCTSTSDKPSIKSPCVHAREGTSSTENCPTEDLKICIASLMGRIATL